jgi:hypothetical protein
MPSTPNTTACFYLSTSNAVHEKCKMHYYAFYPTFKLHINNQLSILKIVNQMLKISRFYKNMPCLAQLGIYTAMT